MNFTLFITVLLTAVPLLCFSLTVSFPLFLNVLGQFPRSIRNDSLRYGSTTGFKSDYLLTE